MFNKNFRKKQQTSPSGFRYRGLEGSRLEYLTDAVFAFSITLLVIASEVPKTYIELKASMYSFVGFIACIMLLLSIWNNHSVFFLKYGLKDQKTKVLNFLFLFVLLFYIYPLKYLFSYIGTVQFVNVLYSMGVDSEAFRLAVSKLKLAGMNADGWYDLMIRFGIGLLLIHAIFALMYWNALKKKKEIQLNKREVYETKTSIYVFIGLVLVSVLSICIVLIGGGVASGYAGMAYLLVPVNVNLIVRYRRKKMNEKYPAKPPKTKKKKHKKKKVKVVVENIEQKKQKVEPPIESIEQKTIKSDNSNENK